MKYNIDNRLKDTAIVNLTDFLNVIDLYEDDETEKALELCIGLITLGLGGTFETDDREIKRLLRNRQYTVSKSNEIPAHRHKITYPNAGGPYGDAAIGYPTSSGTTKTWMAEMCKTESAGGGTAHNNMPPYLAVYMWKRTA